VEIERVDGLEGRKSVSERKLRTRSLDGLSLGLLCLLLLVSGLGASRAGWVGHLKIVPVVAVLAVLAGAALARSRFGWRRAAVFAAVYGVFVVGWQLARTLDAALTWRERLLLIGGRVEIYADVLLRGDRNQDPLMFALLIAAIYWWMGAQASWSVFRGRGLWAALIPAGIVLLIHAYYYTGRAAMESYVGAYVFLTMIFVLARHVAARRAAWDKMRTEMPVRGGRPITQAGLLAAILLVALAWGGPAFARSETAADLWTRLSRPWPRLRERIGDLIGNLGSPALVAREIYNDTLRFGAGTEPANTLVMHVQPDPPAGDFRFYWRARVYDTYLDREWSASPGSPLGFNPAVGELPVSDYGRREPIEAVFFPHLKAFQVLYLAGQPLWVDRPSLATVTYTEPGRVDVTVIASNALVMGDQVYRLRALMAVPTAGDLRGAGSDYPAWVREGNLQLPETITPRTRALAAEITAGAATPYDQVVAVTRWLREHIAYSRITQAPPGDAEPIDWLLFDYRVGFCNYYASAEVILLRILGIPSRLAVGYASGTYDATTGIYEVRGGDAHAWPEVFFPGYGWVEFEPTASLLGPAWGGIPAGEIGEGDPLAGDFDVPDTPDQSGERGFPPVEDTAGEGAGWFGASGISGVAMALAGIGLVFAGFFVWLWLDPYAKAVVYGSLSERLRRIGIEPPDAIRGIARPPATTTARLYLRWTLWLARLGIPITPAQTPFERAQALTARIPDAREASWSLVTAYAGERFGGRHPDEAAVRVAWRSLRSQLRAAWATRLLAPRR